MLEGVRRTVSHRREAGEKARLLRLEKERRLSYIRMKRLEEHKAAEEELKGQVGAELSAHKAAKQALRERKLEERELRRSRGPGVGMRAARGIGKATKAVLYTLPVKSVRAGAKLGKGPGLQRIVMGDVDFVLGKPRKGQSLHESIFGPTTKTPNKGKDIDILG